MAGPAMRINVRKTEDPSGPNISLPPQKNL